MSISISAGTVIAGAQWSPLSGSFDVGTNPDVLLLAVVGPDRTPNPTIGGVPLTQWASGRFLGFYADVYGVINPGAMSGSQAVASDTLSGGPLRVLPYAIYTDNGAVLADTEGVGGAAGVADYNVNTTLSGFTICCTQTQNYVSPVSGMTVDDYITFGGAAVFGHETSATSGPRTVGFLVGAGAVAGVTITEAAPVIVPYAPGAESGIPSGFTVPQGDPVIYAVPAGIVGASVGIPSGFRISAEGPAEVVLAVRGKDRPQWTEPPHEEGAVLTWHPYRKPTWETLGASTLDYGEDEDISTLDYDDTAAAGSSDEVARADHVHGMPSSPGGGSIVDYHIQRYTAGSISLNSTSWADVSGPADLVVDASAGDILMVGISALWGSQSLEGYLDFATRVSGSPVNYISGGAAGSSNRGVVGWQSTGSNTLNEYAQGALPYVVQEGDISGGTVTLRLRYRTSAGSTKTLFATDDIPLHLFVTNVGQ